MKKPSKLEAIDAAFGTHNRLNYYKFRNDYDESLTPEQLRDKLIEDGKLRWKANGRLGRVTKGYKSSEVYTKNRAVRKLLRKDYYTLEDQKEIKQYIKSKNLYDCPVLNKLNHRGLYLSEVSLSDLDKVKEITQEWLHEKFHYESDTGHLVYKRHIKPTMVGKPLLTKQTAGYYYYDHRYSRTKYLVHRLVWMYHNGVWPNASLDHINGIRTDNRIENLREATHKENLTNRPAPMSNTSGYKNIGIRKTKLGDIRYQATIVTYVGGKKHIISRLFRSLDDALVFRDEQLIKHHGEFAYLDYPVGHPKHVPFNK